MTLKLSIQISADASGAKKGVGEVRNELHGLTTEAKAADAQTQALNTSIQQQGAAATATATALGQVGVAERSLGTAAADTTRQTNTATTALRERQTAAKQAMQTLAQLTAAEDKAATAAVAAAKRTSNANSARSAQAINARLGVRTDFGTAQRGEDVAAFGEAYTSRIRATRAELIPLAAAQQQYVAQLGKIRQAEREGALSATEAAAAITKAKTAFAAQVPSLRAGQTTGASAVSKLRPDQKVQLSYQTNDIFTSLASGMNPLMVAAQQGPQITQAFGGIKPTLAALGSVINPVTASLGLLTGAVVIGGKAWSDYLASTKEVETAASSFGQAVAATPRELEAIATAADVAGTASVTQARSMEASFLRTGKIGTAQFTGLIGISKNFAATMQTDVASGSQQLAQLFADPAAGAAKLRSMGLLDGATQRLVQHLSDQNKVTEAQNVLLQGVSPRLANAANATTALGRAAEWAGQKWDGLWNALGRGVDRIAGGGPQSVDGQLAAAQEQLAAYSASNLGAARLRAMDPTGKTRAALEAQIADLQEQLRAQRRLDQQRKESAAGDQATSAAIGVAVASPANDNARQQRQLQNELTQLQASQGKAGLTADEQTQITRAIEGKTRALAALSQVQQRQAQLDQLDVQIQSARDPVTRANLTAQRERVALSEQEIGTKELDAAVERARTRVIEESLATSRTRLADMSDETAARKTVNDQVAAGTLSLADADRQLRLEQELRPLITAALSAEGEERKRLNALIDQTRAAYAASATQDRRGSALSALATQKDEIDSTRLQLSLIGQSEATRARATAALEMEQRIRQQGIDTGSREAAQLRERAVLSADLSTTLARQSDAWQTYASAGGSAIDSLSDALGRNQLSWSSLKDTLNNIAGDIGSTMAKLAIANPLKNALFGTNLGTSQDLGGVLGGLMGNSQAAGLAGGKAVGAMTVTAGTVMINGTVAGGVGGLLGGASGTGGMSGVLGVSKSFEGLNENKNTAAISGILSGSGTAQLDPQSQAWCAAYANAVLIKSGYSGTGSNMASSFQNWGKETTNPQLGDIVNLKPQARGSSGHVGFFGGRDANGDVLVSGGNQSNGVNTTAFPADQVVSFRTALGDATSATSTFGAGIGDATKGLTSSVGSSVTQIGTAGQSLAGATTDAATSANSFTGGLSGVLQGIINSIGQAGSGIGNIFSSIFGGGGGSGGIGAHAGGGHIFGPGTGTSDSILARLSNGEFVSTAKATAKYGPVLEAMNADRLPAFVAGGYVGNDNSPFALVSRANRQASGGASAGANSAPMTVNVINNAGASVSASQGTDASGNPRLDLTVDQMMATSAARPGSRTGKALGGMFGLKQVGAQG